MMKKLLGFISALCVGMVMLLSGCKDKEVQLPNIEGNMEITAFKTYLSFATTYVDSADHDLYYGNVKVSIILSTKEEDEVTEVNRKEVTIDVPKADKNEENPEIDVNMKGNKVEFSSLKENTEYTAKLIISSKGSQKTLDTKTASTISNGETADDPISITSVDLLLGMNKSRDAYYRLDADIDCNGEQLSSIFSSSSPFIGHFDGNNHTISNFKLYPNTNTGLFGYLDGAEIKNLKISKVSYDQSRTDTYLGALAGYAKKSTIQNIKVDDVSIKHSGTSSRSAWIGGLVGMCDSSTITDCEIAKLDLNIPKAQLRVYAGGFIGYSSNTEIKNCSVEGKLTTVTYYNSYDDGVNYIGGFVGVNDSIKGIENSYAKVDISITEPNNVTSSGYKTHKLNVGGFMGGNIMNMSIVRNCAAIGQIDVAAKYSYNVQVGGFAGILNDQNASLLENCLYYPTGEGLKVVLAVKKTEEEKPEETTPEGQANETDTETETEPEKTQVAYLSLSVGKLGKSSRLENVFVYQNLITIENQHADTTIDNTVVVSTDISSFSQKIQEVIAAL